MQLGRILGQALVAHFGKSELAFDHPEWMLNLGPGAGLCTLYTAQAFLDQLGFAQRLELARPHGD